MPDFPLLDLHPPHPDASHSVIAPGGYEWWYFDAEDHVHHRQLVAIFFDGCPFHPGYLRADARFRRDPTRQRPAVPGDFPCVYFVVYENGRVRRQFMMQFSAKQFSAARDRLAVTIGGNAIASSSTAIDLALAGTPLHHTVRGPRLLTGSKLNAQLRFEPRITSPPDRRRFLSRAMTGADHYWQIASPLCEVTGTLQVDGESIAFRGRGYHDHHYGTAPLGPGVQRWMRGRVLNEDSTTVLHLAEPAATDLPTEINLFRIDAHRTDESVIVAPTLHRERHSRWRLAFPEAIDLGDPLRLTEPRIVDAAPFFVRLQYAARSHAKTSRALVEIVYPHRLRWPLLGRMIERSIDHTSA